MIKTNKAAFKHYLTSDIQESLPAPNRLFVLDGEALLHQVKWLPKVIYKDVAAQYLRYGRTSLDHQISFLMATMQAHL